MSEQSTDALLNGLASTIEQISYGDDEAAFHRMKGYQDAIHAAYIGGLITRDEWADLCRTIFEMLWGVYPRMEKLCNF